MNNKVNILGVPFSKLTMAETVSLIGETVEQSRDKLFHVITANPEFVMGTLDDPELKKISEDTELITPDGIGIVMAAKWNGEPVAERVAGYDLLLRLLEEGDHQRWSFYFLGSSEEVSRLATDKILERYPNVRIAGRHNGFFKEKEAEIIAQINDAKPDFLIVALGAPRQEKWIYENKHRLHTKVAVGVGGSLDVIAGKVKRAPAIWQKLNLEWFYRLLIQPSRWKRQLALPKFAIRAYFAAKKK